MKNVCITLASLFCCACLGNSIPILQQAAFFSYKPTNSIAGNTWVLIASNTVASTDGGTSCTTSALDTRGASLIVIVQSGYSGVNPVSAPTSNPANTFTRGVTNSSSGFSFSGIYWATNLTTAVNQTFSTSTAQTFPGMTVLVYSNGVGTVDQTNSATASASTIQTGAITPTADNDLIVAGVAFQAGSTATIGSGFSVPLVTGFHSGQNIGVAGSYLFQGFASAINPTYTLGSSSSVCATIMSFKQ